RVRRHRAEKFAERLQPPRRRPHPHHDERQPRRLLPIHGPRGPTPLLLRPLRRRVPVPAPALHPPCRRRRPRLLPATVPPLPTSPLSKDLASQGPFPPANDATPAARIRAAAPSPLKGHCHVDPPRPPIRQYKETKAGTRALVLIPRGRTPRPARHAVRDRPLRR